MEIQQNIHQFTAPSGHQYSIREQNGADEDVMSNQLDVENYLNVPKFIQAIIISTSYKGGKLSLEEVEAIPILDKWTILIQSRIFSLGKDLEFNFKFSTGESNDCVLDLNEFLYNYENQNPTDDELDAKPDAVPYYPLGTTTTDISTTLRSGKQVKFDLFTGKMERLIAVLPLDKITRNTSLTVRNLQLLVDNQWEPVKSFHLFTPADMADIRMEIEKVDPPFSGRITITSVQGTKEHTGLFSLPSFFYPGEV